MGWLCPYSLWLLGRWLPPPQPKEKAAGTDEFGVLTHAPWTVRGNVMVMEEKQTLAHCGPPGPLSRVPRPRGWRHFPYNKALLLSQPKEREDTPTLKAEAPLKGDLQVPLDPAL